MLGHLNGGAIWFHKRKNIKLINPVLYTQFYFHLEIIHLEPMMKIASIIKHYLFQLSLYLVITLEIMCFKNDHSHCELMRMGERKWRKVIWIDLG